MKDDRMLALLKAEASGGAEDDDSSMWSAFVDMNFQMNLFLIVYLALALSMSGFAREWLKDVTDLPPDDAPVLRVLSSEEFEVGGRTTAADALEETLRVARGNNGNALIVLVPPELGIPHRVKAAITAAGFRQLYEGTPEAVRYLEVLRKAK